MHDFIFVTQGAGRRANCSRILQVPFSSVMWGGERAPFAIILPFACKGL